MCGAQPRMLQASMAMPSIFSPRLHLAVEECQMTLMHAGGVSAPLELAFDHEALPAPVSRPGNQQVGTASNLGSRHRSPVPAGG